MTKANIAKVVIAIVVVVAIAGAYIFPKTVQLTGSPIGSTFNTAKLAAITFSLLNSTSTSILNTDSSMRLVHSSIIACTNLGTSNIPYTGGGLASLTMRIGTTSTATPTPFSPFAQVGNITVATATVDFLNSSSTTQTATSSQAIEWAAGTNMTFGTNATNTATCTVGVSYVGT